MRLILLLILSFNVVGLNAQFQEGFNDLQNDMAFRGASIGICFVDVSTGETLFGNNAHQFFYPASVQKVITTAGALSLLGSDYRYETKAYYTGEVEAGVLKGSIRINSSGDPTTNSAYFNPNFKADFLQALKLKGVKEIEGLITFDKQESVHGTPQSWLYEDIGNYYGVASQKFNYKDNLYRLTFQQKQDGNKPEIVGIKPQVPYSFDLLVTCSSAQKGDNAFILGAPFSEDREISGSISAGSGTFTIKGANAHPQYTFIEEIMEQVKMGSKLGAYCNEQFLCSTKSPSLEELVQVTNFESINLFAEGIINTLGLIHTKNYSTQGGLDVLHKYISQKELDTKGIILKDGSGLSRLNAMTPHFAAQWICEHYENESFRASLPISGESGTLRYLNHAGIKGLVHAKSGSAEGVLNYAGYFQNKEGRTIAFAIFINQAYQSKYSIRREIGAFLAKCI